MPSFRRYTEKTKPRFYETKELQKEFEDFLQDVEDHPEFYGDIEIPRTLEEFEAFKNQYTGEGGEGGTTPTTPEPEYTDEQWQEYVLQTLNAMNAVSAKGFAFNMLTKYSDKEYMRADLYYGDPLFLFDIRAGNVDLAAFPTGHGKVEAVLVSRGNLVADVGRRFQDVLVHGDVTDGLAGLLALPV